MKCTNCGASIPGDAGACPECGVFARVIDKPRARSNRTWILGLLLLAVIAGGATYFFTNQRTESPPPQRPIRVVRDRPGGARIGSGATISEPEAILRLQRSFTQKPECIAIMSKGYDNGAYNLVAVNRCDGTKLGRWRVDGKSGAVSKRLMGQ